MGTVPSHGYLLATSLAAGAAKGQLTRSKAAVPPGGTWTVPLAGLFRGPLGLPLYS